MNLTMQSLEFLLKSSHQNFCIMLTRSILLFQILIKKFFKDRVARNLKNAESQPLNFKAVTPTMSFSKLTSVKRAKTEKRSRNKDIKSLKVK